MLHCLYIERQIVQNILHMLSHAFVLSAQAEGNERRKDIQSKNQRTQPEPAIKFVPLQTSPLSLLAKGPQLFTHFVWRFPTSRWQPINQMTQSNMHTQTHKQTHTHAAHELPRPGTKIVPPKYLFYNIQYFWGQRTYRA